MVSFGNDELVPHFIYSGEYYNWSSRVQKFSMKTSFNENFKEMFLTKMEKFGIKSSILTMLGMFRRNLITNEKAKDASEGKLKNEAGWEDQEVSINDDLEMFLTNLLNSKEIKEEVVRSFFTPKLTEEELKLVEAKNEDHLNSYFDHGYYGKNPDVDPVEMKKSDSKSKYVHGWRWRRTFPLTLEKNEEQEIKEKNKNKKKTLKNCCNCI